MLKSCVDISSGFFFCSCKVIFKNQFLNIYNRWSYSAVTDLLASASDHLGRVVCSKEVQAIHIIFCWSILLSVFMQFFLKCNVYFYPRMFLRGAICKYVHSFTPVALHRAQLPRGLSSAERVGLNSQATCFWWSVSHFHLHNSLCTDGTIYSINNMFCPLKIRSMNVLEEDPQGSVPVGQE